MDMCIIKTDHRRARRESQGYEDGSQRNFLGVAAWPAFEERTWEGFALYRKSLGGGFRESCIMHVPGPSQVDTEAFGTLLDLIAR